MLPPMRYTVPLQWAELLQVLQIGAAPGQSGTMVLEGKFAAKELALRRVELLNHWRQYARKAPKNARVETDRQFELEARLKRSKGPQGPLRGAYWLELMWCYLPDGIAPRFDEIRIQMPLPP